MREATGMPSQYRRRPNLPEAQTDLELYDPPPPSDIFWQHHGQIQVQRQRDRFP